MKKIITLLLAAALFLSTLTGCTKASENNADSTTAQTNESTPDVLKLSSWDGSTADSFAGGKGTASDPFQITTPSQLSYLAKKVNSGMFYADTYFILQNDLNLNYLEWTPIGNGTYSFNGHFNGNNHTISNLKIIDAVDSMKTYPHTTSKQGMAGLFGYCKDASICNLNIENASIATKNVKEYSQLYMGILAARIEYTSEAQIQNIKISKSNITCYENDPENDNKGYNSMQIGGLVGSIYIQENAHLKMDRIYSNIVFGSESVSNHINLIGGIIGTVTNKNLFECSNFACYLTVYFPTTPSENYAGAFGNISNNVNSHITLSNAFSEIKINHEIVEIMAPWFYKANSIIGNLSQGKNANGEIEGASLTFSNLFGSVKPIDSNVGFSAPICKLYEIDSYITFSETNCHGCVSLPQNHGLDEVIWDLTSLSMPQLK